MEIKVPIGIGIVVVVGLLSAAGGLTGGVLLSNRDKGDDGAATVAATADLVGEVDGVVETTGEAVEAGITAAQAEDIALAAARAHIAEWDSTTVAVKAAIQPGASRSTVALAGYLGCVSGAQGKSEGSAAFGCTKRGEALDLALAAMPALGVPAIVEPAQE
jgi:hypothetical protein